MTDQPARPATGAESLGPRLRAAVAVLAYLQQLPAEITYLDPVTRNAIIWRAVHAALDAIDPEEALTPAPAPLRDRYAAAIASYDHAVGHATNPAPGDHHHGQADAVMAVRDQEVEQMRAERDELRDEITTAQNQLHDMARKRGEWQWRAEDADRRVRIQCQRAETVEAAIDRVRKALDDAEWGGPDRHDVITEIRAVLDPQEQS